MCSAVAKHDTIWAVKYAVEYGGMSLQLYETCATLFYMDGF